MFYTHKMAVFLYVVLEASTRDCEQKKKKKKELVIKQSCCHQLTIVSDQIFKRGSRSHEEESSHAIIHNRRVCGSQICV